MPMELRTVRGVFISTCHVLLFIADLNYFDDVVVGFFDCSHPRIPVKAKSNKTVKGIEDYF